MKKHYLYLDEDEKKRLRIDIGLLVEGKAKELCPVDTGLLRSSISSKVVGTDIIVGTNVPYAPHVEFGTMKMKARSFLRSAAFHSRDRIIELIKKRLSVT